MDNAVSIQRSSATHRARSLRRRIGWALLLLAAVIVAGVASCLWERPVQPMALDYVHASRQPDGTIVLVGAWDAFSPCVLNSAEHEDTTAGLRVYLYYCLLRNRHGDSGRIFWVRIPADGNTLDSLVVDGGGDEDMTIAIGLGGETDMDHYRPIAGTGTGRPVGQADKGHRSGIRLPSITSQPR